VRLGGELRLRRAEATEGAVRGVFVIINPAGTARAGCGTGRSRGIEARESTTG